MRFLKGRFAWVVPTALAAALVAALVVSPALGINLLTPKKAKKIIANKTNATELRIAGQKKGGDTFNLGASDALIAELPLTQGNYVVTSTFTLLRDTGGLVVNCQLSAGSGKDGANAFGGGGQLQDNVGLSVTASVPAGGNAQLRCVDGSPGTDSKLNNIEITALKVPKITLKNG